MANPTNIQYKTLKKIFSTTDEIQQGKTINEWHVSQMINAFTGLENYDIKVKGIFNIEGRFYFKPPLIDDINTPHDSNVRLLVADDNDRVFYRPMSQINNIFPLEINKNNRTAWNHGMGGVTSNTSFGYSTYINNTVGFNNTLYGSYNLVNNTTGNNNNIYGTQNMPYSSNASNNFLFSIQGLFNNISGNFNIGVGLQPLYNNIDGDRNIGIGNYSLFKNISGNDKIGIGTLTLASNNGNGNIAIGNESSRYDTYGNNRITIGNYSGKNLGSDWLEIHSYEDPFDDSPALILGHFGDRWLRINGNLKIDLSYTPTPPTDVLIPYQLIFDNNGNSYLGGRSYSIIETDNILSYYVTKAFLSNYYYTKIEVDKKFQNGSSESVTAIQQPTLVGNILTIKYTGENGILQEQTVDLSGLATIDVTITDASYNASTNIITLTDTKEDTFNIDLSEFSILVSIDANGIATLTQEGVTKLQISKVGRTGDYNDLLNKPELSPQVFQNDINVVLSNNKTVGRYGNGDVIPVAGKTFEEFAIMISQETLPAVIFPPSFKFTKSTSVSLVEVGSSLTFNLVATFNPGGIYGKLINGVWQTAQTAANKQDNRSGLPTSFVIDGTTYTTSNLSQTKSVTKTFVSGTNTYSGLVNFAANPTKPRNSANEEYGTGYSTPLSMNGTQSIDGIYPVFYGVINEDQSINDINISLLTKLLVDSTDTVSIPFSGITGKRLVVLIPSESALKTKWYVTALNSGPIGNVGNLFSVESKNYDSPNSYWSNKSFRVYLSSVTSIDTTMELQN